MMERCPNCDAAELVRASRDLPYTYRDETTIIPAVTGGWCSACGEVLLDHDEATRVSVAMKYFSRRPELPEEIRTL